MAVAISPSDMQELKRMATNYYGSEKELLYRVIMGINGLQNENKKLAAELNNARTELANQK